MIMVLKESGQMEFANLPDKQGRRNFQVNRDLNRKSEKDFT